MCPDELIGDVGIVLAYRVHIAPEQHVTPYRARGEVNEVHRHGCFQVRGACLYGFAVGVLCCGECGPCLHQCPAFGGLRPQCVQSLSPNRCAGRRVGRHSFLFSGIARRSARMPLYDPGVVREP